MADEHPSVAPWHDLMPLLAPWWVFEAEAGPDVSLEEFLARRRALAVRVSEAADAVIDAIDAHPADG